MFTILWKLTSLLICSSGCIWQLTLVFDQYFRYYVSTEVMVRYLTHDTPPAISICEPSNLRTPLDIYNKTPTPEEFITGFRIQDPNSVVVEYTSYSESPEMINALENLTLFYEMSKYVKLAGPCYRYGHRVNVKMDLTHSHELVNFQFYLENSPLAGMDFRLYIIMHSADTDWNKKDEDSEVAFISKDNLNQTLIYAFEYYEQSKLESPYTTKCYNYLKSGCKSRDHCIEQCLQQYFNLNGFWLTDAAIYDFNSTVVVHYSPGEYQSVRERCEEKHARPNCREKIFTNYAKPTYRDLGKSGGINLFFYQSHRPSVFITFRPYLAVIEFVIYVFSTLSFWLCVTPLSLLIGFGEIAKERVKRKKANSRVALTCDSGTSATLNFDALLIFRLESLEKEFLAFKESNTKRH